MDGSEIHPLTLEVDPATRVSALLQVPRAAPRAGYVFAHGAGAGMHHRFMAAVAARLATRAVATLRYQFPAMERGSKRPDRPALAHATVRAAVAEAGRRLPDLPWFAGGKSFGGRMTSQAQAEAPLPGVRGLVFLGFPLHPAGEPGVERATHLARIEVPMLFVQGSRDAMAAEEGIKGVVAALGARADLVLLEGADHGFERRAADRAAGDALDEGVDAFAAWLDRHATARS